MRMPGKMARFSQAGRYSVNGLDMVKQRLQKEGFRLRALPIGRQGAAESQLTKIRVFLILCSSRTTLRLVYGLQG